MPPDIGAGVQSSTRCGGLPCLGGLGATTCWVLKLSEALFALLRRAGLGLKTLSLVIFPFDFRSARLVALMCNMRCICTAFDATARVTHSGLALQRRTRAGTALRGPLASLGQAQVAL